MAYYMAKRSGSMSKSLNDTLVLHIATLALPRGAYLATPKLDLHATDFTIAAQVRLDSIANRNILLGNWSSNQNAWQMLLAVNSGGKPALNLRKDFPTTGSIPDQDLVGLVGTREVRAQEWHHVAATFTWGDDRKTPVAMLYLDGESMGRATPTIDRNDQRLDNRYTLKSSPNAYLIGRKEDTSDNDSWFAGQINNLRIYTSALTGEDLRQLL
ncbi:LamG domain-containing protein [Chloroflexia bacterium SDU3-3]|nr:LamG domain-containing protein [Chloroflexia bacterium SDU3-3]